MGLFEQFPYTNFHELNLAWLLDEMKKLAGRQDELEQFVRNYIESIDIPQEVAAEVLRVFNEKMTSGEFALALAQFYDFIATPEICGAVGDGITDDTAAFVTLSSLPKVYVPKKSYRINSKIIFTKDQVIGNDGTYTNETPLMPYHVTPEWSGKLHALTRTITGCQGADFDTRRDKLILGYVGGIYRMDFDGLYNLETFVVPEVEHANDLAYVYETDRVYVAPVDTVGVVIALNAADMSYLETVALPIGAVISISYDADRKLFYLIADNAIYTYTPDFQLVKKAPFTTRAGKALWPNNNPYTAQQGSFYYNDVLYRIVSVFDVGSIAISARVVALDIASGDLIGVSDCRAYSHGDEAEGGFIAAGVPYIVSFTNSPATVYIRKLIPGSGYIEEPTVITTPNGLALYVDETATKCGSGYSESDPVNDLQIAIDLAKNSGRRTNIWFIHDTVLTTPVSLSDFAGSIILEGGVNNTRAVCSRRINLNRVYGFHIGPRMTLHHADVCLELSRSYTSIYSGAVFEQEYAGGTVNTGKQACRLIGGSRIAMEGVTFNNCHVALRVAGGCIAIADSLTGTGNGIALISYRGAIITNSKPTAANADQNDGGLVSVGTHTL